MLCSARELKLSDDHEGLLVLDDGAGSAPTCARSSRLDDTIFTLKLTPNLGHALSVFGVAREVAAITGAPLTSPTFAPVRADERAPTCRVAHRGARPVRALLRAASSPASTPGAPTPRWMVDRLARCGQRTRRRRWSTSRTT